MAGHAQPHRLSAAELRARVVELRRKRWQFEEIGRELGFSRQRAWAIYQKALAEIPAAAVTHHRAEEQALIDDAMKALMEIACDPEVSPRTRVEAWTSARSWAEHKARILGLNAPVKVEVSDEVDAEIARLAAALAAGVGNLEPAGEAAPAGDAAAG